MAFDGKKYTEASNTLPVYYHAGAPFQGPAVSNCLQNAYYAGQQSSRLVLQQSWPVNMKRVLDNQTEYTLQTNALVTIARNWAHIPENITHLVCSTVYAAMAMQPGTVQHQLTITNAASASLTAEKSTTLSGVTVNSGVPLGGRPGIGNAAQRAGAMNPNIIDFQPLSRSSVEIKIEKDGAALIALDQICDIKLEARAYSTNSAGAKIAEFYRPHFVSVFWEVRAE